MRENKKEEKLSRQKIMIEIAMKFLNIRVDEEAKMKGECLSSTNLLA